ncbi:MAG: hypothetical protein NUV96_01725 [Candidatus Colwellbacteria bacterium]|nr:hypothetical protein [Candidatus Colwellbacteria bacterium]
MAEIDYMIDYDTFASNFRKTEVSGEEVGEMIMRLAGYFARYNVRMGDALRAFSRIKADFQSQIDTATGKTMSSAKAEMLADATDEAATYEIARIHIQNLEQYINGLKALQKGVLQEYSHAG